MSRVKVKEEALDMLSAKALADIAATLSLDLSTGSNAQLSLEVSSTKAEVKSEDNTGPRDPRLAPAVSAEVATLKPEVDSIDLSDDEDVLPVESSETLASLALKEPSSCPTENPDELDPRKKKKIVLKKDKMDELRTKLKAKKEEACKQALTGILEENGRSSELKAKLKAAKENIQGDAARTYERLKGGESSSAKTVTSETRAKADSSARQRVVKLDEGVRVVKLDDSTSSHSKVRNGARGGSSSSKALPARDTVVPAAKCQAAPLLPSDVNLQSEIVVQQHSKAASKAASKAKKVADDKVRALAESLAKDLQEIDQSLGGEGSEKARLEHEEAQRQLQLLKHEIDAHQASQLQQAEQSRVASQLQSPEALALRTADNVSPLSGALQPRLREIDPEKNPTVFTTGWLPDVQPNLMLKMLADYKIGALIDARPLQISLDESFRQASAAHGFVYEKQPVLGVHPADLTPNQGASIYNVVGRLVSHARSATEDSSRRQCIIFAGEQRWPDDCRKHIMYRLKSCKVEALHISLEDYWKKASEEKVAEDPDPGLLVSGPHLTQVVDELGSYVGLPMGEERDKQLMVTARAGLETWIDKKFAQDTRLKAANLPPEATLKEKIDCMRGSCPELQRVVDIAHVLRMVGNASAHNSTRSIPQRWQLIQLVQRLTSEIREADVTAAISEAHQKEEAEAFAPLLTMLSNSPWSLTGEGNAPSTLDTLLGARQPATFLPQLVISPLDGTHRATLVYLHSYNSSNQIYFQAKEVFASNGIKLVLPLAPNIPIHAHDNKEFSSWFDYSGSAGGELEVDPLSLEDIRVRLSLTLKREAALLGEEGHKKLIVGGVSQGGAAAMHAALMHPVPVAGILGVCTTLLPCTPPEGCGRLKVHLFAREVEPESFARDTLEVLQLHHTVVDHGDMFGCSADEFDPATINKEVEADCLRSACEAILEWEDSGALQRLKAGSAEPLSLANFSFSGPETGSRTAFAEVQSRRTILPPGRITPAKRQLEAGPRPPALPPPLALWNSSREIAEEMVDEVLCIEDDHLEEEDRMIEFAEEDQALEERVLEFGEEELHIEADKFQESGTALSLLVNLEKASARSSKRLRDSE